MSLDASDLRLAATGLNLLYILSPSPDDVNAPVWYELAQKLDSEADALEAAERALGFDKLREEHETQVAQEEYGAMKAEDERNTDWDD